MSSTSTNRRVSDGIAELNSALASNEICSNITIFFLYDCFSPNKHHCLEVALEFAEVSSYLEDGRSVADFRLRVEPREAVLEGATARRGRPPQLPAPHGGPTRPPNGQIDVLALIREGQTREAYTTTSVTLSIRVLFAVLQNYNIRVY